MARTRATFAAALAVAALTLAACGSSEPDDEPTPLDLDPAAEETTEATPTPTPEPTEAALYEVVVDQDAYAPTPGRDYLIHFERDEASDTTQLATYTPNLELVAEHTETGQLCSTIVTAGTLDDGLVLTGYHEHTEASGLTEATDTYGLRAYNPATWEPVWATQLPDATDKCTSLEKGRLSASETWFGIEGNRAINLTDGSISDPVDGTSTWDIGLFMGDWLLSYDRGDWHAVDPATGEVEFTNDKDNAAGDIGGMNVVTPGGLHLSVVPAHARMQPDGWTGGVRALSTDDGSEVWRWATDGNWVDIDLELMARTVEAGFVLVPTEDEDGSQSLVALDAETGTELYTLPSVWVCGAHEDRLVVITSTPELVVVDAATGEELVVTDEITECSGMVADHVLVSGGVARVL